MQPWAGFQAEVHSSGYKWAEPHAIRRFAPSLQDLRTPCLLPIRPATRSVDIANDHPLLFRDFSDLEGSPQSVIGFANQFGLLRAELRQNVLDEWQGHIAALRAAREMSDALWELEAAKPRTERAARKRLGDAIVAVLNNAPFGLAGDIAREGISGSADRAFVERLFVRLGSLICRYLIKPEIRLLVDAPTAAMAPHDLAGALWVQWIVEFQDGHNARRCAACGRWFRLGSKKYADGRRSDAKTCSPGCRQALSRKRRRASTSSGS